MGVEWGGGGWRVEDGRWKVEDEAEWRVKGV